MIRRIIKKYILLFIAVLILLYTAYCNLVLSTSISMNALFMTMICLLILLQCTINYPIKKEVREPSFIYIFVKVTAAFYFLIILSGVAITLVYPKTKLNAAKQSYDYIIVFGAGINDNKTQVINSRLDEAISFATSHKDAKLILTGCQGPGEMMTEALYMKNYLVNRGITENRLILDEEAKNTYENIINSLELIVKDASKRNNDEYKITRPFKHTVDNYDLDFLNIGFLSSDFHMSRINMIAKKCGILKPYSIESSTKNSLKPYMYLREVLSLFKALALNQLKV